jgi:outer membrane protein, multidrug efflux system
VSSKISLKRSPFKALTSIVLASLVADCTVGPDYRRPDMPLPSEFRSQIGSSGATSFADMTWQNVFADPALQKLIAEGIANNYDLQIAVARIKQARELVDVVHSEALPQFGYDAFAGGEKTIVPGANSVTSTTYSAFGGLLNAAWEIDVWGRIRRATEAAKADLYEQEDVRRGVVLTLVSDLAAGYYQLLELDRQLAIANESVASYKKTLDLFTDRFNAGKDSELPVTRTQAAYESARANASIITRQIAQQENALSVLVGAAPEPIERGRPLVEQTMPPTPLGSTTDLLRRRPDILGTEQAMISANAQIGVAVANFYPTIGLSALGGGEGVGIQGIVHGFTLWSAAASAAGPIFTGGRLQAEYRDRQAYWDETVAEYKKTILGAFQETSDALIAQQTLVKQRENLERQVRSLQHSVDLALIRYDGGRASYFEILEAQQQLYPAEYELALTQQDQLIAVVNLYKALGGGWTAMPVDHAQSTANAAPSRISSGGG